MYNIYIYVYCFLAELGSNQQYFSNVFFKLDRLLKSRQEHRDSAAEIVDSEQSFDNGMKFGQLSVSMINMLLKQKC